MRWGDVCLEEAKVSEHYGLEISDISHLIIGPGLLGKNFGAGQQRVLQVSGGFRR